MSRKCSVPLCQAIAELNKDAEDDTITPDTKRYAKTWHAYLSASGDRGMINDLPCNCKHKHFTRGKIAYEAHNQKLRSDALLL